MLNNQTIDAMHKLRLPGMAAQYRDQTANPTLQALGFDDRIGPVSYTHLDVYKRQVNKLP